MTAGTLDDIGQWPVTMVVSQDINKNGHGFHDPYRGVLDSIEAPFVITVNPCIVDNLISTVTMSDMTYRIGNPDLTQGSYFFADSPNSCGYE